MGLGGISIWQLLIVLAIVIMIFGTKRLRGLGSDLGSAVKGFKQSLQDEPAAQDKTAADDEAAPNTLDKTSADDDGAGARAPFTASAEHQESNDRRG
jgi:sec-independent protein translocase protein TatA